MGVEHYMICDECKEYIDLHKRYAFSSIIGASRPPFTDKEGFGNGYWDARGLWFLWHHKDHGSKIRMNSDVADSWFEEEPFLKEVYPHKEDLKIREKK